MVWQDLILMSGASILTLALVPTILDKKEKPAFLTSMTSGVILLMFSFVYSSLLLWLTALVVSIHGVLWLILAYQKYGEIRREGRRKRR